jgi:putative ABC transport system permease protein
MRFPLWGRRQEEELEEEIKAHLEMAKRDRMERGESAEDAAASARREFGNVGLVKEITRDVWGWGWLERLTQDVHYGARMLRKNPGFTLIAVMTLALGIGANTTLFSVINGVLLRPLAFNEPARIARLYQWGLTVSPPNFLDLKNQSQLFEHLAAYRNSLGNLTGAAEAERVSVASVSADFFKVLKVEPILGRAFLPEEDKPGGPRLVVLSYGFWQQRYGADPDILGKTLTLDDFSCTIIGVMPRESQYPFGAKFWRPLGIDYAAINRIHQNLDVIGRLKPGATWQQARAEIDTIAERLAREYPEVNSKLSLPVVPITDVVVGPIRPALLVLLGAVGFVLLIACANVANLLLARAAAREKEVAIRAALGAGRWRLMRQMLTESLMLALAGGALAFLLAIGATKALVALSAGIPRVEEIAIDWHVLSFTFAISLLTSLIFGILPALQISKPRLNESLKEGGHGSSGVGRPALRSLLVISEIALSLVLLVGAGLMIKSFRHLRAVDPGFDQERVLSMRLSLPRRGYQQPGQTAALYEQLLRSLAALPGVEVTGATGIRPFSNNNNRIRYVIEGRSTEQFMNVDFNNATPNYFSAIGIPLLKGRVFTEQDTEQSILVTVISDQIARSFFPNEDPIGQRITPALGGPTLQIIGVVGDVKHFGLDAESRPTIYVPFLQKTSYRTMYIVVRASGDAAALTAAVLSRIRELEKNAPIYEINTLKQIVSDSVARERFSTLLFAVFAAVALLLALVGVYGVMSYMVEQCRHEIGIRMALGAQISDVYRLVVRQGMILALAGITIGIAAALALAKLITSFSGMLHDVSPTDSTTYVLIALLLLAAALISSLIPARRATKVDPLVALRCE